MSPEDPAAGEPRSSTPAATRPPAPSSVPTRSTAIASTATSVGTATVATGGAAPLDEPDTTRPSAPDPTTPRDPRVAVPEPEPLDAVTPEHVARWFAVVLLTWRSDDATPPSLRFGGYLSADLAAALDDRLAVELQRRASAGEVATGVAREAWRAPDSQPLRPVIVVVVDQTVITATGQQTRRFEVVVSLASDTGAWRVTDFEGAP